MKSAVKILIDVLVFFHFFLLLVTIPPILIVAMFMDIKNVIATGFGSPSAPGISLVMGFFIFNSRLPFIRKYYQRFPWLNAYVMIMFVNVIIVEIAHFIINVGYEVDNAWRHALFIVLMLAQIIVGRLLLSLFVKRIRTRFLQGR